MNTQTRPLCLTPHPKPRNADDGLLVCHSCRTRAQGAIAEIPAIHRILEHYLDASSRGASSQSGAVAVTRDPGLRLDMDVAAVRADIESLLTTWVSYAMSPRPLADGSTRAPFTAGPADATPAACSRWILTHIDWFLADTEAADFVHDVTQALTRAHAQRQRNHLAKFAVGPCPEPDCDGTLITEMRPADDLLPSKIWCDKAPTDEETGQQQHVWPSTDWIKLGTKITGQQAQAQVQ